MQVSELVEDAKASGARVAAGGKRFSPNGKNGYFYEPTVLADVQVIVLLCQPVCGSWS